MQTLQVKTAGPDGKPFLRDVQVIRSWSNSSGQQLFLHADGVYGYKDGSPMRDKREFELIANEAQRNAALRWWEAKGEALSKRFYEEKTQREIQAAEVAGTDLILQNEADLDACQYIRRPVNNRKASAYGEPHTWTHWFDHRPEWWGHAFSIQLGPFYYKRMDPEPTPEATAPEPQDGQKPTKDKETF